MEVQREFEGDELHWVDSKTGVQLPEFARLWV